MLPLLRERVPRPMSFAEQGCCNICKKSKKALSVAPSHTCFRFPVCIIAGGLATPLLPLRFRAAEELIIDHMIVVTDESVGKDACVRPDLRNRLGRRRGHP